MQNDKTIRILSGALADSYVLMLKLQNVHWNVVGPTFFAVHNLTEQQYNEAFTAIDELAERIRALGGKSPGTMREFLALTSLREGAGGDSINEMVRELEDAHRTCSENLQSAIKDGVDDGTEDMLVDRIKAHDKAAWMWRSIAGESGASKSESNGNGKTKLTVTASKDSQPERSTVAAKSASMPKKTEPKKESKSKPSKDKKSGRMTRSVKDIG